MSYGTFEGSVESGQPVEFFDIEVGPTSYHVTSGESEETVLGNVYTPLEGLTRGKIDLAQEARSTIVEVMMPASHAFPLSYVNQIPGQKATLTIYRLHRDDTPTPAVIVIFEGSVQSVSFEQQGRVAKLSVVPSSYAKSRTVPRFTFQGACNHVLGDARCKVDENAFKFTSTVSAVSGNTITVVGANVYPDGYFTAGRVDLTGSVDSRLILSHIGSLLTLLLPFGTSPIGSTVTAFAGCAHDGLTCFNKFNNTINYGGWPFIPNKNPFNTGLL